MRGADILQLLAGLVSCTFVNYVKHKLPRNIEDVDDNRVVEVNVVSQVELESAGCFLMLLAMFAIFCQVFERIIVDVVPCSFEHVFQPTYG
jgi:hypothetical protein